ncbi:MAG TPA: NYN domain-containing protein [Aquabacterium sp.]|nr:NYN domain-containing protein [Aquabacterium sp.]
MASTPDHISMALFCDFENVALGVRDANYEKFDIKKVMERLLLKGSIVVKKAYCDWERYKGFKAAMHEANFELIEIPHVRQSGKNSADIRLVVDALDLCYTKSHVNTFVIISGDSDFSPLVSKLRENAKYVIGVGVKQSTSDLLTANCDEFIFYDDLVRESQRQRRDNRDQAQPRRSPEEEARRKAELDTRRTKAVEMAAETYDALVTDRDEGGKIWASVLKEAIKRRNPGFNENYYGFRTFGNLLEEARARGLLDFGRDEKSGTFVSRGNGVPVASVTPPASVVSVEPGAEAAAAETPTDASTGTPDGRGRRSQRGRGGRGERGERGGERMAERRSERRADTEAVNTGPQAESVQAPEPSARGEAAPVSAPEMAPVPATSEPAEAAGSARRSRSARGTTGRTRRTAAETPATTAAASEPAAAPAAPEASAPETAPAAKKTRRAPARKTTPRARKAAAPAEGS